MWGESTGGFPSQTTSNAEKAAIDDVIMKYALAVIVTVSLLLKDHIFNFWQLIDLDTELTTKFDSLELYIFTVIFADVDITINNKWSMLNSKQ